MAEPAGSHQPLRYRDHIRLRALHKNLHSRFDAVRLAAAGEIQAILRKQRGVRAWFGNRAKAVVRKVTPERLHGPLRVKAGAPQQQAPKRGQATPIRAKLPAQGARAPHGPGQTMAGVKQRARDEKAARKQQRRLLPRRKPQAPGAPQRQQAPRLDAMAQAQAAMRGDRQQQPARNGSQASTHPGAWDPEGLRTGGRAQDGFRWAGLSPEEAGRDHGPAAPAQAKVPPLPGHPEAVRKAAEDKRPWTGLDKHRAGAPPRIRIGRSRNRTA